MQVVYTAPNRAHHYRYASALQKAGHLKAFVSGFSRLSPRASLHTLGNHLHRADLVQTLYMASLKVGLPSSVSSQLAFLAKIEQDWACRKFVKSCDVFLFYNGSGLASCKLTQQQGGIGIVEAVNSHVAYQEQLLRDEYKQLKLPWIPFHSLETQRRIAEYELADYILLPSEFVKQSFIKRGFPENKLLKVPYGFDQYQTSPKRIKAESGEFTILYVGSLSVRKGVRYLIQAFSNFQHPRKKLVLVGPKNEHTGFDDLVIPANVVFTGVLKGDDLVKSYQAADVFCLPSIEEGLALVLGEALSFGIPIITTINTGASDIITNGEEGYILPIKDAAAILEKLQHFADCPYVLQEMREKAMEKAETLKGWDETGQRLIDTITSLPIGRKFS